MLTATQRGLTRDVEIQAIGVWDTVGKLSLLSSVKLLTFIEGALGIPTIPFLKKLGLPDFLHEYKAGHPFS